jgi:crotonobetainyl-CoA:carnitine CoA-transferase CaiB-like acyl-CoA transferase
MTGPLEGLRVVELGWGAPASITGMLLADYGARVIKAERPGGGPDRKAVTRRAWDRGKWSIELDLAADRDALLGLVGQSDVLIDALGAGRSARHELGYEHLHGRFPHLVVSAITGYGYDSPWIDRPGYDALVAARLGQMAEQPGPPGGRDGPKFLGHPSVAYGTAFVATIGTLAALRARHLTGQGQLVDASLLDGILAQSPMNWWWNETEVSYLARSGNEQGFGRGRLITDLLECQDGEWVIIHTGGAGGFKRAMDLLGFGDRIRAVEGALEMSVPLDDDEYHIARHLVPEAMKTRPRAEWIELFHAADLAAIPVLRPAEILLDDQVQFAEVVIEQPDDDAGTLRMAGPVIKLSKSPAGTPAPAPAVGAQNAKLAEILAADARTTVPNTGAVVRQALAGVRILDFSGFFAAAYGTKLLRDLGADVIKVEPVEGDQMRPLPDPFEACQRGKRDVALDLKSPAGRDVVRDLVRTADVVVHNLRPGKAEKIGLGYEDLRAIRPDLIYCYLPGFGSAGPKAHLKSFAPLQSGFTGLLWEGAGVAAARPVRRVMGNEDYNNGFVGAIAILLGLEHRTKTGEGQYIESPQLHSSLLVTTEQCLDADGKLASGLMIDPEQLGWGPLYRLYRTDDGWICITCVGDHAWARLQEVLGVTGFGSLSYDDAVGDSHGAALIKALEARFAELTTDEAVAALEGAGVPCEVPLDHPHMPDFLWDEWAYDNERVLEQQHAEYGYIREIGFVVRLSESERINRGPGPLLGEHTVDVLTELGYDTARIDELIAAGTCLVSAPSGEE